MSQDRRPSQHAGKTVRIAPSGPLRGVARIPGSKSLANRHLVCGALADGVTTLRGVPGAGDVQTMIACLERLGVTIARTGAETISIGGCHGKPPAEEETTLDAGDAGTVMRFLTALCALGWQTVTLDGSHRMRARPIGPLVDGLRGLGARIEYLGADGLPPIRVHGQGLAGGAVEVSSEISSQFLSALLLAAPYAQRDVLISARGAPASAPYIDMTLSVMGSHGVEVVSGIGGGKWIVPSFQRYAGGSFAIEPDASAAAYLWSAAAVTAGSVRVEGLSRQSPQGDVRFAEVLAEMGCGVEYGHDSIEVSRTQNVVLRGIDVDLNTMPDTVQALAAVAMFAAGPTVVRNVAHLRYKESDRLAGLAEGLTLLGARVTVTEHDLAIEPPGRIRAGRLDTCNDHRMAMSFTLIGLAAPGIELNDASCVRKSFPDFFEALRELTPL